MPKWFSDLPSALFIYDTALALSVPNMSLSTYKLDGRSSFREKRTYFGLGCHNRTGVRRRFIGVKGIEYTHVLD